MAVASELQFPIFYAVVLLTIAIVGVVSNVVVMVVILQKHMSGSCSTYLTLLAMADIFALTCMVLMYTPQPLMYVVHGTPPSGVLHIQLHKTVYPIHEMADATVAMLTLFVTFDHFIYSFKPKRFVTWGTQENAVRVCVTAVGMIFLMHFLSIFKLRVEVYEDGSKGRVCISSLYNLSLFRVLDGYVYAIAFELVPTLCIIVLDFEIVRRKIVIRRTDPYSHKPDLMFCDGRSTTTILALGLLWTVCALPTIVVIITVWVEGGLRDVEEGLCTEITTYIRMHDTHPNLHLAVAVMTSVYSTVKLFVYTLCNSQFRDTAVTLFFCQKFPHYDDDRSGARDRSIPKAVLPEKLPTRPVAGFIDERLRAFRSSSERKPNARGNVKVYPNALRRDLSSPRSSYRADSGHVNLAYDHI